MGGQGHGHAPGTNNVTASGQLTVASWGISMGATAMTPKTRGEAFAHVRANRKRKEEQRVCLCPARPQHTHARACSTPYSTVQTVSVHLEHCYQSCLRSCSANCSAIQGQTPTHATDGTHAATGAQGSLQLGFSQVIPLRPIADNTHTLRTARQEQSKESGRKKTPQEQQSCPRRLSVCW